MSNEFPTFSGFLWLLVDKKTLPEPTDNSFDALQAMELHNIQRLPLDPVGSRPSAVGATGIQTSRLAFFNGQALI